MDEKEIWQSATVMVKRYGDEAAEEAMKKSVERLAANDPDGSKVWLLIRDAIKKLQQTEPSGPLN